jgi:hypothetical protein
LEPSAFVLDVSGGGFRVFIDPDQSMTSVIAAGVIGALIGFVLTWRFRYIAVAVVGFFGGVFIVFIIFDLFQFAVEEWIRRALMIIAGTALAITALRQPDETMIVLSCILGADLLVTSFQLNVNSPLSAFVWLSANLAGIIFQINSLRLERLKNAAGRGAMIVPPAQPAA